MKQLHALIIFAFSLIGVLSFTLLGTYNNQLPLTVKLTVPQFIQKLAIQTTNLIDNAPDNTFVVYMEATNLFSTGSQVLAEKIQQNYTDIHDNLIVFSGDETSVAVAVAKETNANFRMALTEIQTESTEAAQILGYQTFIQIPETLQNTILEPVSNQLAYFVDTTVAYTKTEVALPLAADMSNTFVSYNPQ